MAVVALVVLVAFVAVGYVAISSWGRDSGEGKDRHVTPPWKI